MVAKKTKNGRLEFSYDLMTKIRPGDIVYHYSQQKFLARSIVKSSAESRKKPDNIDKSGQWAKEGWQVKVDIHEFSNGLKQSGIWDESF